MTIVERREVALVDLLDRLLAGGVVITGDITLRIADVDLVRIDFNALISSVNEQVPSPFEIPRTVPRAAPGTAAAPDDPRTEEPP